MLEINTHFDLGEVVYFVTDEEQRPFIVTEICFRANAYVEYECSRVGMAVYATACELTKDRILV